MRSVDVDTVLLGCWLVYVLFSVLVDSLAIRAWRDFCVMRQFAVRAATVSAH